VTDETTAFEVSDELVLKLSKSPDTDAEVLWGVFENR
jgi:hypothetical protein